jgi:hypothetical protein
MEKRFPNERNRNFQKNRILISGIQTGDVFHPGSFNICQKSAESLKKCGYFHFVALIFEGLRSLSYIETPIPNHSAVNRIL